MTPVVPLDTMSRSTVAAVSALVVVGIAAAIRVMTWYWPGSFFDGVTSNVWTALAWNAAHGEFYRPVLGPAGYGGTRYMPVLFVVHGLLIRAHFDPVHAGIVLMQLSVVVAAAALFLALRVAQVPVRLALPLAGTVWGTVVFQKYCTDLRADYLAAALAMLGASFAAGAIWPRRPLHLAGATAICALAGLTKVTAIGFVVPITLSLLLEKRRDLAARFALGTVFFFAAAIVVLQLVSDGRFADNLQATFSGGMVAADLWHAVPKFGQEVVSDPFVAAPFAIACWALWTAAVRRRLSFAHVYFAATTLITLVVFASPGVVANQLVDLHLAGTLVVGIALYQGELSRTVARRVYGALAVLLVAISLPVPGLPSVIATLRAQGPRQRAVVRAVRDEFLPPGTSYLSTDPIIPVLNGERAVLLDAFSLERFVREGSPAGRDIERRVRDRDFDVIIVRDNPGFPHDMNAGDPGFDEASRKYWAAETGELSRLFRSAYEARAIRKPFVILLRAASAPGPVRSRRG